MYEAAFYHYLTALVEEAVKDRGVHPQKLNALLNAVRNSTGAEQERHAIKALGELSAAADIPDLGLRLANGLPFTAFGMTSLGLPIAPTLRDGLSLIARFHQLISPIIIYDLIEQEGADEVHFVTAFHEPVGAGGDQLVLAAIIFADRYFETFSGKRQNLTGAELTTDNQKIGAAIKKALGVEPVLNSTQNRIRFAAHLLDGTSDQADPLMFGSIVQACEAAEAEAGRARNIPQRVANIITAHLANPPELSQIAERLQITERQLRFALARASTSYQAIIRNARVAHAQALLADPDLPITSIAYRLGYSDPANFTAAFKRWTGQTPRAARTSIMSKETKS